MPTHQKHPNERNPIIVMSAASILMYAECLIASGVTDFIAAKHKALAKFNFAGVTEEQAFEIRKLVWKVPFDHLSRSVKRLHSGNVYHATIVQTGAKDWWLRRCLWDISGLWL